MTNADNKWLGAGAQAVCAVIIESVQGIKDHSSGACKLLTGDWYTGVAIKLGNWCRTQPHNASAKAQCAKTANKTHLVGHTAAKRLLDMLQGQVAGGNVDSNLFQALQPFVFLLSADEMKTWVLVKDKHTLATGCKGASPGSSSSALKRAKLL